MAARMRRTRGGGFGRCRCLCFLGGPLRLAVVVSCAGGMGALPLLLPPPDFQARMTRPSRSGPRNHFGFPFGEGRQLIFQKGLSAARLLARRE